jgi:hypothetical protein
MQVLGQLHAVVYGCFEAVCVVFFGVLWGICSGVLLSRYLVVLLQGSLMVCSGTFAGSKVMAFVSGCLYVQFLSVG